MVATGYNFVTEVSENSFSCWLRNEPLRILFFFVA